MGILHFALVGNYKRFYGDLKEISKINGKSPIYMFIDTAISTICFGSGLQDYLNYKFYEKSFKERRKYVTIGILNKSNKKLANIQYSEFISNKINFHKNYKKYAKREYISLDEGYENFEKFIKTHKTFVKKPIIGIRWRRN